jgi:hypothetical protein
MDLTLNPDRWTIEGRPLTDQERTLALSATRDELQAMLDLGQATLDSITAEVDAGTDLVELLNPYWTDPAMTVDEVIATMPPDKRAAAKQLLRGLPQWIEIPR